MKTGNFLFFQNIWVELFLRSITDFLWMCPLQLCWGVVELDNSFLVEFEWAYVFQLIHNDSYENPFCSHMSAEANSLLNMLQMQNFYGSKYCMQQLQSILFYIDLSRDSSQLQHTVAVCGLFSESTLLWS